tara:strand:- start:7 stop:873 length:867 start_codon:yes stop_codon:yes gene_type:complete
MISNLNSGGLRSKGILKEDLVEKNKPLISVITVVYNNRQFIERCISSVLNQTYDNVEYIVLDGLSTDGTVEIIQKYDNKLDFWLSEKDEGIYDAINKGIKLANGFTLMLHSDDFLNDNDTLSNVAKKIKNKNHIYFGSVKNYNELVEWFYPKVNLELDQSWLVNNPIPHQSVFIFHKLHKNYLFDQKKLSMGNDRLILTQLSRKYEVIFINELITCVQLGGDSNNWKNLRKVFDYNHQHLAVDNMLGINNSLRKIMYLYITTIIKFFIFKCFGRKTFYKFFYKKYLKV